MTAPSPASLPVDSVFHGRYRVVRRIKAGGMGAVYEVVDDHTAAPRALKVMLPSLLANADQRARFALEAKVTGAIESDHLVRIADAGVDEASSAPFLAMELLRGDELGDLLKQQGTLPSADVVTYLSQAALALDKTHAANVVHRDLKPDNLFLTRRDDGSPCLKILDFGIAKVLADNPSSTRALGTPVYMAPEQFDPDGALSPRTDLYALAHVAYALLVGEPYWTEESKTEGALYSLLMSVGKGAKEPASARAARRSKVTLPAAFDEWFFKATDRSPDARFERASEQMGALAQVLVSPPESVSLAPAAPAEPSIVAVPATAAVPAVPARRPRGALFAGLGVLVALAAVAGVLILRTRAHTAALSPTAPGVACPPGNTCANLEIGDLTHVDPGVVYPMVEKVMRSLDPHFALTLITCDTAHDGTCDVNMERPLSMMFVGPSGSANALVRGNNVLIARNSGGTTGGSVPGPPAHCSARAAWKAAMASGLVAGRMTLVYAHDVKAAGPIWTFSGSHSQHVVDPHGCTVRSSMKW